MTAAASIRRALADLTATAEDLSTSPRPEGSTPEARDVRCEMARAEMINADAITMIVPAALHLGVLTGPESARLAIACGALRRRCREEIEKELSAKEADLTKEMNQWLDKPQIPHVE